MGHLLEPTHHIGEEAVTAPTELSEIYSKAADLIDQEGWAFEASRTQDGKRCATTAVNDAAGRETGDVSPDLFEPFVVWLRANRPDQLTWAESRVDTCTCEVCTARRTGIYFVQHWNDTDGRTAEQVVSALRDFAASPLARAMKTLA
jgi:hypothetical protein